MKEITKGSIVKYPINGSEPWGHYRVSAVIADTVNLKSVFGSKIYYKRIPIDQVQEDEDAWYQEWTQSESYMSM